MSQFQSWLDDTEVKEKVLELIAKSYTNSGIAGAISARYNRSVSEKSIRRAKKRWGVTSPKSQGESPRTTITGDSATVVDEPKPTWKLDNPVGMLEERGLDPKEWIIDSVTVNEWDGPQAEGGVVTYHQMKLQLKRRTPIEFIVPARSDGWKPQQKVHKVRYSDRPKFIVITGDQQAPFHDENLHRLFLDWLKVNNPDEGVLLGDTVDFPDISRHRFNPESTASVNECIQSGYNILRDYVDADPNVNWTKIPGNHDERIRNAILDNVEKLYGIKPASKDGEEVYPALSLSHLLRLDELGIRYIDPEGQYDQAQVRLSNKLAVRHGWLTTKNSAAKTLDHLRHSIIVGHTHRQSLTNKTLHDIDGNPKTITAAEAGCMCKIDGLGYAVNPDWQQGFATAYIWEDGTFRIDFATYVDNVLYYSDQRFK